MLDMTFASYLSFTIYIAHCHSRFRVSIRYVGGSVITVYESLIVHAVFPLQSFSLLFELEVAVAHDTAWCTDRESCTNAPLRTVSDASLFANDIAYRLNVALLCAVTTFGAGDEDYC